MPELPEVETMVRGIRGHVIGRTIRDLVECPNDCRPISIRPTFRTLRKRLVGRTFHSARRIGKRVVLDSDNGWSMVIEPRMTGLVLLSDPPSIEHLRLRWDLDGPAEYESFWFWDRRGLGVVSLYETSELATRFGLDKLGPDALEMTLQHWESRCAESKREIKVLLLDQKIVAGIGNLYASEILHRAAIHPETPANSLTKRSIERLAEATQAVLIKAIELEGSTLGDGTYRTALSQRGNYQNEHLAYMRAGQHCRICQGGTIQRIVQAQRSTFFCGDCQKVEKSSKNFKK